MRHLRCRHERFQYEMYLLEVLGMVLLGILDLLELFSHLDTQAADSEFLNITQRLRPYHDGDYYQPDYNDNQVGYADLTACRNRSRNNETNIGSDQDKYNGSGRKSKYRPFLPGWRQHGLFSYDRDLGAVRKELREISPGFGESACV